MNLRSLLFACLSTFIFQNAVAGMIARYPGLGNSTSTGAKHVIVVGVGNDLGNMFLKAAMGKVAKLKDSEPESEILIYAQVTKDLQKESQILSDMGLELLEANNDNLPLSKIFKSARVGRAISSLTFYVHSAITYGIHLYKGGRYDQNDDNWDLLKGYFQLGAYVHLIGCNTGYYLAPALSLRLQVPVAGALTSTDFQYLNDKSEWKYAAPTGDLTYPQVEMNRKSFSTPVSCQTGVCSRMQPYYRSYSGYWGDFKNGGFPGFKFFCNAVDELVCEKVMAISLTQQVSNTALTLRSSESDFRLALADLACPQVREQNLIQQCRDFVLNFQEASPESNYSPFWEKTLACDLHSCQFDFKCEPRSWFNSDVSCLLQNPNLKTNSFAEEIRHYIRGIKAIVQN